MTVSQPAAFLDGARVLTGHLPEQVSMAPIIEGAPFAYEKTVFDGPDGFCAVWACGAGVFPRVKDRRGSFMYLLSGEGTIVDDDGTAHELVAHTVLVLPYRWVGTWHIRKTIRKVYVHTTPTAPLPEHGVPSAFSAADRPIEIFDGPDGHCSITDIEPGAHDDVKDERSLFAYTISGAATVTEESGEHDLTPGSVIALPADWKGTWNVRERMRLFVVRSTPAIRPNPRLSSTPDRREGDDE